MCKRNLIVKKLSKKNIRCSFDDRTLFLEGNVDAWEDKIEIGYFASKKSGLHIVNNIKVASIKEDGMPRDFDAPKFDSDKSYDVVIIGGGVVGLSILRELSRYDLKLALLEKESDVGLHASTRNDGMIHPGFGAKGGTKKLAYNLRGNKLYDTLVKELDIPYIKPGSMILYGSVFMLLLNPIFKLISIAKKVPKCRYVSRRKLKKIEPYISVKNWGAFLMPTSGQLSPLKLVTALAENSVENGADIILNCLVKDFICKNNKIEKIITNRGNIDCKVVINSAGAWADWISEKAGDKFFSLHFRKGEDLILDTKVGKYVNSIYAMPKITQQKSRSKGGGLVKTVEGNVLVGPTAYESPYREDYSTTDSNIDELMKHIRLNSMLSKSDIITYFAGIRACTYDDDFIVEKSKKINNFIVTAGIQSPGLASAPAIAEDVVKIVTTILGSIEKKKNFNPKREKATPVFKNLSLAEREKFILKNPKYGKIVCRCEQISEGEILDALREPFGAKSVIGVKNRVGAMTGRCHGGFCTQRIIKIMQEKFGEDSVFMLNSDSKIFFNKTKGIVNYED